MSSKPIFFGDFVPLILLFHWPFESDSVPNQIAVSNSKQLAFWIFKIGQTVPKFEHFSAAFSSPLNQFSLPSNTLGG